jgi:hypothetical protein
MNLTATNAVFTASFFLIVASTDYLLDKNVKRALIVGTVATVAALAILYLENEMQQTA